MEKKYAKYKTTKKCKLSIFCTRSDNNTRDAILEFGTKCLC